MSPGFFRQRTANSPSPLLGCSKLNLVSIRNPGVGSDRYRDKAGPNRPDSRFNPDTEGATKDSFSSSPDLNVSSEGSSMAVRNRRLMGRRRTNILREPMLQLYSLVAGGLLVAVVIRIALVS